MKKKILAGLDSFEEYQELLADGTIEPGEAVEDIKYLLQVYKELVEKLSSIK